MCTCVYRCIECVGVSRLVERPGARRGGGGEGAGVAVPAAGDARAVAGVLRPDPAEADPRVRVPQQGGDARPRGRDAAHRPGVARATGTIFTKFIRFYFLHDQHFPY